MVSSTAHLEFLALNHLQACQCVAYIFSLLAKGPEFIAYPFLASTALYIHSLCHIANRSYLESGHL